MIHKEQLRKQIIQYFRSVGSGQNILQCIKEALFLHQNFNPVLLFQVISKGKQKITTQDWKNYLLKQNINFSDDDFKYFMKQNQYKSQITLNQFLQSMIPYNADVVRQFKQKYLDSIQIRQFDPQVQFIFTELIDNQLKLFRNLISIRQQITKSSTLKGLQYLVKQDLVLQSKPRQGRKFHESFQNKDYKLGFHELRKFFQLWVPNKQIIHQFYMLNVIRHLKSNDPFCNLIYKARKNKVKNNDNSNTKRAQSARNNKQQGNLTNQKIKKNLYNLNQEQKSNNRNYDTSYNKKQNFSNNKDKYIDFKDKMMNQYIETRKQALYKDFQNSSSPQKNYQKNTSNKKKQEQNIPEGQRDLLRRSRQLRQAQGIDGTHIIKFLQQIVVKQERLQKLRKTLAKNNDFNLINLFKLIDTKNKGYITAKDISDFTLIGKVQFNHMVNFYARQADRLRFLQFCLIFRPLSKQLNEIIDSRPQHKVPNPFKNQTNKLILQVATVTAQLHSNLQKLRQKMDIQGMDAKSMFIFLDLQHLGYLDAQSLERILKQNNVFCDDKNIKCLMKLFRKKIDERISLGQFSDFVSL